MTFFVPPNYRQVPQAWELSMPFRVDGSSSGHIQGPVSTPGLNWIELPPDWDPTVSYDLDQAVFYNHQSWVSIEPNVSTTPGEPIAGQ